MPNANIIDRLTGAPSPAQGAKAIPQYTPTSTNATIVPSAVSATTAAVVNVGGGQLLSGASTAPSFASNYDGFAFKLRVVGKVTTGAACNVTVAIVQGTTTTYASGNVVATTGAKSVGTTSSTFYLECIVTWDNVSQKLAGVILPSHVNNSAVSAAALTNAVSVTAQSSLQFGLALTFSDTTATTTATISEFVAETV